MKIIIFSLLALLFVCGAMAQSEKSQKQPSRFIFGVSYRYSLGIVNHVSLNIPVYPIETYNAVPDDMQGGALLLNLGWNVTDNWAVALEFGVGRYAGGTFAPIYAKAQYFYGNKRNRWFNYANLGATIDSGPTGMLSGLGGGYRIKLGRRTCLDFTVG